MHENTLSIPIHLTQQAISQIGVFIRENNYENTLRIYVERGSCSGTVLGLSFSDHIKSDDYVFYIDGITVFIDPVSLPYLKNTTIDFINNHFQLLKSTEPAHKIEKIY